jgi:hypothetical protein
VRSITAVLLVLSISILLDAASRVLTAKAADNVTAVVADEAHGVIRIMIGGKEAARFTAEGLQVRDDIEYGGSITDTGSTYFDQYEQRTGAAGAH